jgi:glucan biosynthesis protein C
MGAFFFVAGLMMPASLRRAGKWSFLAGRVRRLVLPALVLGLLAAPPVVWTFGMAGVGEPFWPWWLLQVVGSWQPIVAHAWFLLHLALYAALYAALAPWLRKVRVDRLSHAQIAALTAGMAFSEYLTRLSFPIDDWVTIARTVPVEPAHLPQYACLFWLGILAGQGSFLRTFPDRTGLVWLTIGLAAALLRYLQVYIWRGVGDLPQITATGGAGWPSLVWCVWESVLAVGLTLGLVTAFRRWCDRGGPLLGWVAAVSFAVYLVHPFIIVPIQGCPGSVRLAAVRAVPARHGGRHGTLASDGPAAPAGSASAHRLS